MTKYRGYNDDIHSGKGRHIGANVLWQKGSRKFWRFYRDPALLDKAWLINHSEGWRAVKKSRVASFWLNQLGVVFALFCVGAVVFTKNK